MYYYTNIFFLFSIIGHFLETIIHPSYDSGILVGYWTPVYGFGVVIILLIYEVIEGKIINRKWLRPILLVVISTIILSVMEMIGGYLIQMVFHRVFWNYKGHKFNIGLYTSLEMAGVWGIASLIIVYILRPILNLFINKIPKWITWVLVFLFILDILYKVSTIF